jgi:SAM-dependent methyltransferase
MTTKWSSSLLSIVACPKCGGRIDSRNSPADRKCEPEIKCSNPKCELAVESFPLLDGQPVLIDFGASIIDKAGIVGRGGGSVQHRDIEKKSLTNNVRWLLFGENKTAKRISGDFIADLKRRNKTSRVLIIGGGTIGSGSSALYADPTIEIISVDIYASDHTTFVADAHKIPLVDQSVDGVWIQAVLEHVLDPAGVVSEIHRVLKPNGIVFADTPFMQQVHEGIYDFTRFTLHGQRWLFRRFEMLDAGVTRGAGTSLVWCIGYFVRALTRSRRLGTLASFVFFWLSYADRFLDGPMNADAASGVFFFGRRSEVSIAPKDMVGFYDELRRLRETPVASRSQQLSRL